MPCRCRYALLLFAVSLFLLASPSAPRCRAEEGPPAAPRIAFLDAAAAKAAIVDDSADDYFARLSRAEMAAKTGGPVPGDTPAERIAETKRRYQKGVGTFTDAEKEALSWYVAKVDPVLREHYPRLAKVPWRFIKVGPTIESGFPHTRGGHIVLSEPVLARLVAVKQDDLGGLAVKQMGPLFVHEQLHVLQRQQPSLFDDLYTRVWKFRRAPKIAGAEKLKDRIVVNPDGPTNEWVFPVGAGRWVWPLIVLPKGADENTASLLRMEQVAVDVEALEGGKGFRVKTDEAGDPVTRPLHEVEAYMRTFHPSSYVYHPNEASADLLARLVAYDALGAKEDVPPDQLPAVEAALKPLREWFATNLGESRPQPGGTGK